MANPNGNPQNLKPIETLSNEEAMKRGAAGGVKSGEARREKKRMSEIYAAMLAKKFKVKDESGQDAEVTGSELILNVMGKIVQREDSASVSMIKELREGIDGNMLDVEVMDLTKGMTHQQKKARIEEILANRSRTEGN